MNHECHELHKLNEKISEIRAISGWMKFSQVNPYDKHQEESSSHPHGAARSAAFYPSNCCKLLPVLIPDLAPKPGVDRVLICHLSCRPDFL